MPRKFTPREEERIKTALRTAGRSIMGARGVRKTSIDELARAAGISKGSFYRFYESKESLALELLAEWERGFHDEIEERFLRTRPRGVRKVAAVLMVVVLEDVPRRMTEAGMQGLFAQEEIAHLKRTARPDETRMMDEQDIRLFARLRPLFRGAGLVSAEEVEEEVIIAGLRMIFGAGSTLLEAPAEVPAEADASAQSDRPADGDAPVSSPVPLQPHHYRDAFGLLLEGFLGRLFRSPGESGVTR